VDMEVVDDDVEVEVDVCCMYGAEDDDAEM
jgi:hypothetical protein